ncbi:MAG: hypothetical protein V4581_12250 [Bacteroidota bacterium]
MKKFLVLVALLPLALSCSNDDDATPETPFFNLAEGNMWVYRRYNPDQNGNATVPTNDIDTVRVVGQEVIEGETYFKLTHSYYIEEIDYLRIDTQGHLVAPGGYVYHPGTDLNYTYSRPFEPYGTFDYYFDDQEYTYNVMGQQYSIRGYVNYFTPHEGGQGYEGKGTLLAYQPGIGVVVNRNRFLSGPIYFEDRLEYYELN